MADSPITPPVSPVTPPVETTFPVSPDELVNQAPPETSTTTASDSESAAASTSETGTSAEPITPPVTPIPEPVRVGHDRIVPPVTWPQSVTNIPG